MANHLEDGVNLEVVTDIDECWHWRRANLAFHLPLAALAELDQFFAARLMPFEINQAARADLRNRLD